MTFDFSDCQSRSTRLNEILIRPRGHRHVLAKCTRVIVSKGEVRDVRCLNTRSVSLSLSLQKQDDSVYVSAPPSGPSHATRISKTDYESALYDLPGMLGDRPSYLCLILVQSCQTKSSQET